MSITTLGYELHGIGQQIQYAIGKKQKPPKGRGRIEKFRNLENSVIAEVSKDTTLRQARPNTCVMERCKRLTSGVIEEEVGWMGLVRCTPYVSYGDAPLPDNLVRFVLRRVSCVKRHLYLGIVLHAVSAALLKTALYSFLTFKSYLGEFHARFAEANRTMPMPPSCDASAFYTDKTILAPMVRAGRTPLRLLALEYGADLVYTEETVDQRLLNSRGIVNDILYTVDYVVEEDVVLRVATERERNKCVLQVIINAKNIESFFILFLIPRKKINFLMPWPTGGKPYESICDERRIRRWIYAVAFGAAVQYFR
uniref:tRNA-dihydrouridine(20) synthase [NAD(P)+]-like n=1 Tax=Ascaris lumbricoides TaxID=6252 RepID=A0A0M3IP37_ASCLU